MNPLVRLVCSSALVVWIGACSALAVVDTAAVDRVRQSASPTQADLAAVDEFIADAVQDLVYLRDFTEAAEARTVILERLNGRSDAYDRQVVQALRTALTQGFESAAQLEPPRRYRVQANLLILLYEARQASLVDLALDHLAADSEPVRFWAVKVLTSETAAALINQADPTRAALAQRILTGLTGRIDAAMPDTLGLIIDFVSRLQGEARRRLVDALVSRRLVLYESQKVTAPLLDTRLCQALCQAVSSQSPDRTECFRWFVQLYSYMLQTLATRRAQLPDAVAADLVAAVVDVEQTCLTTLLGPDQSLVKRAIERGDMNLLLTEHDRLLGTDRQRGLLCEKLQMSLGSMSDGSERMGPKRLP